MKKLRTIVPLNETKLDWEGENKRELVIKRDLEAKANPNPLETKIINYARENPEHSPAKIRQHLRSTGHDVRLLHVTSALRNFAMRRTEYSPYSEHGKKIVELNKQGMRVHEIQAHLASQGINVTRKHISKVKQRASHHDEVLYDRPSYDSVHKETVIQLAKAGKNPEEIHHIMRQSGSVISRHMINYHIKTARKQDGGIPSFAPPKKITRTMVTDLYAKGHSAQNIQRILAAQGHDISTNSINSHISKARGSGAELPKGPGKGKVREPWSARALELSIQGHPESHVVQKLKEEGHGDRTIQQIRRLVIKARVKGIKVPYQRYSKG